MIQHLSRLTTAARYRLGLATRIEALLLARRSRYHDAQWAFARASGIRPDSDEAWAEFGRFLEAKEGLPRKVAALQDGLGRGAGRMAQSELLVALVRTGRPAEAMALLERISDPDAALGAAVAAAEAGHFVEAERFARCATTLAPTRADAWFQRGSMNARLARYDTAVAALEESITLDPDNLTTRATLGQVLAHAGRVRESALAFQGILRRDPVNAQAWSSLVHLARQEAGSRNIGEIARQVASYFEGAGGIEGGAPPAPAGAVKRQGEPRLRLTPLLLEMLPPDERIVVLDGGARDAHADPRWRELPPGRLAFHGFEPDPPECERLNKTLRELGYAGAYHPIGLWKDDGDLPFHVNKASGGSSFLDQNQAVTDRWRFENPHQTSLAREIFRPERTVRMPVTSIPNWAAREGVGAIDFCKLNVQGAELDILAAADGPLLASMLGVLAEVGFVESYVGRPYFSDIDVFMRRAGFTFFDLVAHHYVGRADSPVVAQHLPAALGRLGQLVSSWGQLIEGHALYLRDPIAAEREGRRLSQSALQTIKLAVVAEVFGQVEYAFELVQWHAARLRAEGNEGEAQRLDAIVAEAASRYRGDASASA